MGVLPGFDRHSLGEGGLWFQNKITHFKTSSNLHEKDHQSLIGVGLM